MPNIKSQITNVQKWIINNKLEFLILMGILFVGAVMRLHKIDEYMTFLGDEGRDDIIVRRLLVYGDPILIGPGTSIGNMYLGPLYYYMMAPALYLANYSPTGPAIMVALLGVATIYLLWHIATAWFPSKFNFIALGLAALYASSPTAIIFARSSWNPNIMPFFSLLSIWAIWKVWKEKDYKWFIVEGISFAFVLQSHYLGVLLLPVIIFYKFLAYKKSVRDKRQKEFIRWNIYGTLVFAFLMSPLLLFDMRHNFQNSRALQTFLTTDTGGSFKGIGTAVSGMLSIFVNMFVRLPAGRNLFVGQGLAVVSIVLLFVYFFKVELKGKVNQGLKITKLWIGLGIVGLAFVQKEIYDHYMGFLFVAPYLLMGGIMQEFSKKKIGMIISGVLILVLLGVNLKNSPFKDGPSRQLWRAEAVSEKILSEAKSKRFNLAVLAEQNYEDGYRYFLEVGGADVLHADIWNKSGSVADELWVVCEKPKVACNPTHDPKAEVVNFGWTKIESEWEVNGVWVYKLVHASTIY